MNDPEPMGTLVLGHLCFFVLANGKTGFETVSQLLATGTATVTVQKWLRSKVS